MFSFSRLLHRVLPCETSSRVSPVASLSLCQRALNVCASRSFTYSHVQSNLIGCSVGIYRPNPEHVRHVHSGLDPGSKGAKTHVQCVKAHVRRGPPLRLLSRNKSSKKRVDKVYPAAKGLRHRRAPRKVRTAKTSSEGRSQNTDFPPISQSPGKRGAEGTSFVIHPPVSDGLIQEGPDLVSIARGNYDLRSILRIFASSSVPDYSGGGIGDGGQPLGGSNLIGAGSPNSLERASVPEQYPFVMVLQIGQRPLYPGIYRTFYVRDQQTINVIDFIVNQRQPYVGVFLSRDPNFKDILATRNPNVYEIGVFAEVRSVARDNFGGGVTLVLYPYRRIRIKHFLPCHDSESTHTYMPPPEDTEANAFYGKNAPEIDNVKGSSSSGYTPFTAALSKLSVPIAHVENIVDESYDEKDPVIKATMMEIVNTIREISVVNPIIKNQIISLSIYAEDSSLEDATKITNFISAISSAPPADLQASLEFVNVKERLLHGLLISKAELENAILQQNISKQVEKKITKRQREYFLTEQLKEIQKELGMASDGKEKILENFRARLNALKMPQEVLNVFNEEIGKLSYLDTSSSEFNVTRNYLDWLTSLPWGVRSEENFQIARTRRILEEDHYGLREIKDRILEFVAVGKLCKSVEGKVICLCGPPGVGKTSVGKSIARSLGRIFYRFSVGGLVDVAEIKGHRRTYVGAMPGKPVQALKRVRAENPLIMIDEIDKIPATAHGDPSSALLELLDPEQNNSFLDHYLDVTVDFSKVLFMCTANVQHNIPEPLLDRMEIINISGYISEEKIKIAEKYLLSSSLKQSGLSPDQLLITTDAIKDILKYYCRESGVRSLKASIEKICRKVALKIVSEEEEQKKGTNLVPKESDSFEEKENLDNRPEKAESLDADVQKEDTVILEKEFVKHLEGDLSFKGRTPSTLSDEGMPLQEKSDSDPSSAPHSPTVACPQIVITPRNLPEYMGLKIFNTDRLYDKHVPVGVATGLSWTSFGGSVLYFESINKSSNLDRKPVFEYTGKMGSVMKESADIAYSYSQALLSEIAPQNDFFSWAQIHMHVPEGATPKDGPSAGCTMATSILSLALQKSMPNDIAMTGEITLIGKVLRVGGIKVKVIAARRSGIKKIIMPRCNISDWDDLPDYIRDGMKVYFVDHYKEVFRICFPGLVY